jgi:hypothetical protein
MVQLLSGDDPSAVLKAATKLSHLASDSNQDAACMVEMGVVPCLLKLLNNNNPACLQVIGCAMPLLAAVLCPMCPGFTEDMQCNVVNVVPASGCAGTTLSTQCNSSQGTQRNWM